MDQHLALQWVNEHVCITLFRLLGTSFRSINRYRNSVGTQRKSLFGASQQVCAYCYSSFQQSEVDLCTFGVLTVIMDVLLHAYSDLLFLLHRCRIRLTACCRSGWTDFSTALPCCYHEFNIPTLAVPLRRCRPRGTSRISSMTCFSSIRIS